MAFHQEWDMIQYNTGGSCIFGVTEMSALSSCAANDGWCNVGNRVIIYPTNNNQHMMQTTGVNFMTGLPQDPSYASGTDVELRRRGKSICWYVNGELLRCGQPPWTNNDYPLQNWPAGPWGIFFTPWCVTRSAAPLSDISPLPSGCPEHTEHSSLC